MNTFYLQGEGTLNDAVFSVSGDRVHVVAEVGWTGCIDKHMSIIEARKVWENLVDNGWKRVSVGRRNIRAISNSING